MPNFAPVASAPGGGGKGTPAPVPDISTEVDTAIHSIPLRGTAEFTVKGQGYVVDVTDHRDVPAIKAVLKPIENALAIKIVVVVRSSKAA